MMVGDTIRLIREESGKSLKELSALSGMSVNALSLIERGKASPTVKSLEKIAGALKIEVSAFFSGYPLAWKTSFGEGNIKEAENMISETFKPAHNRMAIALTRLVLSPSGGNMNSPDSFRGKALSLCLQGSVEVRVGNSLFQIDQNEMLFFSGSLPHSFHNPFEEPAEFLLFKSKDK